MTEMINRYKCRYLHRYSYKYTKKSHSIKHDFKSIHPEPPTTTKDPKPLLLPAKGPAKVWPRVLAAGRGKTGNRATRIRCGAVPRVQLQTIHSHLASLTGLGSYLRLMSPGNTVCRKRT